MKRFLSLMLAILMVVSMVPTFIFSIGAEGTEGTAGATSTESEFPNLIITEVHANSINFNGNRNNWVKQEEIKDIFYPTPNPDQGAYYTARNPAEGANVSSYFELVDEGGEKKFVKTSDATAVAGKTYYSAHKPSDIYDVFEYIEIYNAGTEAVDLYDYKMMYDSDGTYDNNNTSSTPIHAGGVSSSFHKSHFEKVVVAAGESVNGYYTLTATDNSAYKACAADAVAVEGTEYYRLVENEYYVENPDTAILQPGECAVIWFYTWGDWLTCGTVERFKTYYEYWYSAERRGTYGIDLSNTLVLAVDAWSDTAMFGVSGAWDVQDAGQRNYGIAKKTMTDISDTSRYDKWESWVYWSAYSGIDVANTAKLATVQVGSTVVTGGAYAVYLEDIGQYAFPSAEDGTADANGCAVLGLNYYEVNVNNGSNKSPLANKNDCKSANFLYGFNGNAPLKEGWAYTIANDALNPGILTNVQNDVFPCGETETSVPDLVITEVCPDTVGADIYEYIEVVNTSGTAINIYDYTVLVRTSSYQNNIGNEFFNRFNTIIPGNVGNILAADPGSAYYNQAPTNPDYDSGWLQPGEVAVLWSYYTETYQYGCTFDDFYEFFGMDKSVKIFAMDTDNSARTGRPNECQNLGNSGFYIYGIAKNENLKWYSDPYVSNVMQTPITFVTGVTNPNYLGVPLSAAESYVFANSVMCTCQNVGLGEGYGYQFTYNRVEGTNNKFGALADIATMTRQDNDTKFVFGGSVVTPDWQSSPGKLWAAQKTSMTTNKGASRYVVYMQDFDGMGNVAGYDEVAALIGASGLNDNAILNDEHLNNVKETENKGVSFLEIRDGKLHVNNYGSSDDYMLLMSDAVLDKLRDGNFTVEFSMTYNENCISDGYSTILYNFNGEDLSYGAPIIRVSGYGNNAVFMNNQMSYVEDLSTTANAGVNMNASGLTGPATLYEKLTGKDISSIAGGNTLEGSVVMVGKTLNVKVDVSITTGVTVTVNDVVVSKSFDVVDSAMFSNWGLFLEKTVGSDLVMKTTPNVSVSYDYITVYTDSVDTNANDLDIPELYITEILMDGGSWDFLKGEATSGSLSWIEYIEVTNGSDKPVALKDYSIVTTERNGYLHEGNNLMWKGDGGRGAMSFDTWLGTDNCKAKITKDGVAYNPSENEAVLQPGESILIFTLDTNTSMQQKAMDGTTTDYITAAKSWLQLSDEQLCMVTTKKAATIEDVDPVTLASVGNPTRTDDTFNNWNNMGCMYGVGRNYDQYGNAIDWSKVYTHDYRYIESFINFLPCIAVGLNHIGYTDTADVGKGGAPLGGYPAHFTYGTDGSSYYKQGLLFTRRQNPAMTCYKEDDSVNKTGQYNAGKLYQVQQTCFDNIRKLAKNGYQSEGGLVITEMIAHTNDLSGTNYQAFEGMEITNTASYAINLYDYALAKADDGTYGNPNSWGRVDDLRAGVPSSKYHRWYDQLQNLKNPADGMIQPGESVVLWFYTLDTYNYANSVGATHMSFKDFRNYWAARDNDVIAATDAEGQYTTKVIAVVHTDQHANFNVYDQATTHYGIAKKTEFEFGNNITRSNSIVSSTFSPHYSTYYHLDWELVQLLPNNANITLPMGGSLATSFGWHEELTEVVDLSAELNPTNLCIKNEDGTYSFAAKPYDANTTYYRLYFYYNVQWTSSNTVDDLSFNFVYGNQMTSGWNMGAPLATIKASYYMYNGSGKVWSTNPDDVDVTPYAKVDMISIGTRNNSLGYLVDDQKAMVTTAKFDYVGELNDGTKVYFYETVMGDVTDAKVSNLGASVSFSGSGTEITFGASVSANYYQQLATKFGAEKVSLGMVTARAEDAMKASALRPYLLDAAEITYTYDADLRSMTASGKKEFYGSAEKMQSGYYMDTYSSVGYIKVETCIGDVTLYADTAESRSAKQVLASAVEDYSDVRTDEYCYAVENGKWSRYTAEQRARFEQICAR